MPSVPVMGGSVWTETANDLDDGTFENTRRDTDGVLLDVAMGSNGWDLIDEGHCSVSNDMASAYGPDGMLLIFVGYSDWDSSETCIYDMTNETWHRVDAVPSPPRRIDAAMSFDIDSNKFIMFGGWNSSYMNDTWVFDPVSETWTNMSPSSSPSARGNHAMAYDPEHDLSVMYGGSNNTILDETWTYDLGSNTWTFLDISPNPGARAYTRMTYVDSQGKIFMYGEDNASWLLDLASMTWVQTTDDVGYAFSGPSLAYDSVHDEVIMYPGEESWVVTNRTYIYNFTLEKWSELAITPSPLGRVRAVTGYNRQTNSLIIYSGGIRGQSGGTGPGLHPLTDMWSFDTNERKWKQIDLAPMDRSAHAMHYIPDLEGPILFSGYNDFSGYRYTTTTKEQVWLYDLSQSSWKVIGESMPYGIVSGFGSAFSLANNSVFTYGGYEASDGSGREPVEVNYMYAFDIDTLHWRILEPIQRPEAREGLGLVMHEASGKLVLFGGHFVDRGIAYKDVYLNDTWTYEPATNTWTKIFPADSPTVRSNFGMTYVNTTNEIVLFGGGSYGGEMFNDTWTFDLASETWTNVTKATAPPARDGQAMVYDPNNDHIVMFGGRGVGGLMDDMWIFDVGTSEWHEVTLLDAPSARTSAAMSYDTTRSMILLHGGYNHDKGGLLGDLWLYNYTGFDDNGTYISEAKDLGGRAFFGNLDWDAAVPKGTGIRLQVRTADDLATLGTAHFLGPDGTGSSFFDVGKTMLNETLNDSRYIQYKVYLDSENPFNSPLFKDIRFTYNLMQEVDFTYPVGGEVVNGTLNVTWNGTDPDNDSINYHLTLENSTGHFMLIKNNTLNSYFDAWDTKGFKNDMYRLHLRATDDNQEIPLVNETVTDWFEVNNTPPNEPPTSVLISPSDKEIINGTNVTLRWMGSDKDMQSLVYYVIVAKDPADFHEAPLVLTKATEYNFTGEGHYYWFIKPNDGKMNGTCLNGSWEFTLVHPPNLRPKATLVSPANGSIVNSTTTVTLEWKGVDPEGDALRYLVLMSDDSGLVSSGDVGALRTETTNLTYTADLVKGTYFWTVIAVDIGGNGTMPDIWSFTIDLPHPEVTVVMTSPANGTKVRASIDVKGTATAVETELISVKLRVDGGKWITVNTVNGTGEWSYTLQVTNLEKGDHLLEVQAIGKDAESGIASTIIVVVKVRNTTLEASIWPWIILVVIAIAVVTIILSNKRMARRKEGKGPEKV